MNEPGLEFVWVGDDAVDPLQQAQTLQILVAAGIKTREEARADLGLGPRCGPAPARCQGLNWGSSIRTTTSAASSRRRTMRPDPWASRRASRGRRAVQVANNDAVMSDVGGQSVAQIIEPEPPPPEPEALRPAENAPAAPTGTVAEAVLRNGGLPGTPQPGTWARTMPASHNPTATAKDYAIGLYNGQTSDVREAVGDAGFIAKLPDGSFITFRPAGQASNKTEPTTATVDINDPKIKQLNGGRERKLKFPRK